MVIDDEMQERVSRPRLADQAARTSTSPWWMVRPGELAARYEFDENWSSFEDREDPVAIYSDTQADHPTHCCECHELIPHALTSGGYQYVEEAARANLREALDGRYRKHALRIVQTWLDQYGHHDINGYIDELHAKLAELVDENEDDEEEEGGRLPQTHARGGPS